MKSLFGCLSLLLLSVFSSLCAQEMFLACDSLAIPGDYVVQTSDGGFLLETFSMAQHVYYDPGFALIKLDALGKPEWGRLYPASLGGAQGSFHPNAFLPDKEGGFFAVGKCSTDPFSSYPAVALFSPQGVPIWSRLILEKQGQLFDVAQLRNRDILISGTIYTAQQSDVANTSVMSNAVEDSSFTGIILTRLTSDGETSWIEGIESFDKKGITDLSLFARNSRVYAIGRVLDNRYSRGNKLFLLNMGEDGSILRPEVLSVQSKPESTTYTVLVPEECIATDSALYICGTVGGQTLQSDSASAFRAVYISSAFVVKLDWNNTILWSKRITAQEGFTGPFRATVTTGQDIILTSTNEENPALIVRLDSSGTLLSAQILSQGIEKRFEYPDDTPPHPPLAYCTITTLTATSDGGIAGLSAIDVPATSSEELEEEGYYPFYQAGFFRVGPALAPQCNHPERASVTVEPIEFVREVFPVRRVKVDPAASSFAIISGASLAETPGIHIPSFSLNPVDYRPEVKELCTNGQIGHSVNEHLQEKTGINLTVSPNTLFSGKDVQVEYNADWDNAPTSVITLLNASSGRIYATASGKEALYNQASGRCTATLNTTGLTAGIYLVRVAVGGHEETVKLKVE